MNSIWTISVLLLILIGPHLLLTFIPRKTAELSLADVHKFDSKPVRFHAIVSYVLFAPQSSTLDSLYRRCYENLDAFIERGLFSSPDVHFIFTLVGETTLPLSIEYASKKFANVKFVRSPNYGVDLFAHGDVLEAYNDSDFFLLLNCGARGPYFPQHYMRAIVASGQWNDTWLGAFARRLGGPTDVVAVGATISCEINPHIQTYAVAVNNVGARIIRPYWKDNNQKDKLQIIRDAEVGISEVIIRNGHNIASVETHYEGVDFRQDRHVCLPQYKFYGNNYYVNPTRCELFQRRPKPAAPVEALGCRGLDPCEVVFVKYGGEVYQKNLISNATIQRVNLEDRQWRFYKQMCPTYVLPPRPLIDIAAIHSNISRTAVADNELPHPFTETDETSTIAVIVRAHAGYAKQLVTLLWNLESQKLVGRHSVLILIIPTEFESIDPLRKILEAEWAPAKPKKNRVVLVEIPAWVYVQYGFQLDRLCTPILTKYLRQTYSKREVSRHCEVNSPLHYLIVDIALYHVLHQCPSCECVMVTNADNLYSSMFLNTTIHNFRNETTGKIDFDISMSNMVTHGGAMRVKPQRRQVDLGAYLVRTDFLRRTRASFLSSLPPRAQANDYHDADGHFIHRLVSLGARVTISSQFFFFHDR